MMKNKTHRALNTNIIIQDLLKNDDRTAGGIILPQYDMSRSEGIIEDIGPNAFDDFGDIKPKLGDKVVYARYAGKALGTYADGLERRVMRDLDILCIVDETN